MMFFMATFKSTTFGKISGKHGTAVAATRKDGLNILKVYRIASNPNTEGQKNQRGKFGFVVKELNCMRKLFTVTFGGQYGINRAVSLAMKTCVSGEYPDFKIDYSQLQISKGNVPVPGSPEINNLINNLYKLEWSDSELLNEKTDDNLCIVLLNATKKQMIHNQNFALRSKRNIDFSIPEYWSDSEIHAWLYFSSSNNNYFSDSKYLGLLMI
jgi:hypothetical protein